MAIKKIFSPSHKPGHKPFYTRTVPALVRNLLRDHDQGLYQHEIASMLKLPERPVWEALHYLMQMRIVCAERGARKAGKFQELYRLATRFDRQ